MKKLLFFLISILIFIFVSLTILDYNGEYSAESYFWKINKNLSELVKDVKTTPDSSFNRVAKECVEFINRFPNSRLTPRAHLFLGRIYMYKEDYAGAREKFEWIINKYKDNDDVCLRAVAEIGKTYALQEDIPNVLVSYNRILNNYPVSSLGLTIPLLKYRLYLSLNNVKKAEEELSNAIVHYKNLIKKYPDSIVEFHSKRLLATCLISQDKYRESVNVLGDVLVKYSNPAVMSVDRAKDIIKSINYISTEKLKDYDTPISIYNKFIESNPNHIFNDTFVDLIKHLKELKAKNKTAVADSIK